MSLLWTPSTLRVQFIVLLLCALTIVQGVSVWLFIGERESAIIATLAKDGASRVLTVATALERSDHEMQGMVLRAAESREFVLSIDTTALADASNNERQNFLTDELSSVLEPPVGRKLAISLHRPDSVLPKTKDAHPDWGVDPVELVVSVALSDGQSLNARIDIGGPPLRWALPAVASFALTSIVVFAIVWFLIGRISRPLSRLAENAERLGRGGIIEEIERNGPMEIQVLTRSFEDMAQRLTKLLSERATMLGALGHDLRSPLTAMRLRIEFVDDEETRERLEACINEMQILVQSALAMAKGADTSEPITTFCLEQMLEEVVDELKEAEGHAILQVANPTCVDARRNSLKRAVRNVAENAVRYGNAAYIHLDVSGDRAEIVIDDDGPGIPKDQRENVFSPFVRLEGSRSRETGGSGLGLAIAKAAIETAQGTIKVDETPALGARVIISIPRL